MEQSIMEVLASAGGAGVAVVMLVFFLRFLASQAKETRADSVLTREHHERVISSIADSHKEAMDANATAITEVGKALNSHHMESKVNIEGCKVFREEVRATMKK